MSVETTSEAERPVQEQPHSDVPKQPPAEGTTPAEPSKAAPPVQEHQPKADPSDDLDSVLSRKEVQERIYRQAQAMKDKELHTERQRRQQEQEERRVKSMSNAEYGAYLREQQKLQQQTRQALESTLTQAFTDAYQQVFESVEDPDARKDLEAAVQAGKFTKFGDFAKYASQLLAKTDTSKALERERKKLEAEIREAVTKELQAEMLDGFAPDLGRGQPSGTRSDLHGSDLIAQGFGEKLRAKRSKT